MALRPVANVRNTVQEPFLVAGSPIIDIKSYVPARFPKGPPPPTRRL